MNHAPLLLTPPAHETAIYRQREREIERERQRNDSTKVERLRDKLYNTESRQQGERRETEGKNKRQERIC